MTESIDVPVEAWSGLSRLPFNLPSVAREMCTITRKLPFSVSILPSQSPIAAETEAVCRGAQDESGCDQGHQHCQESEA